MKKIKNNTSFCTRVLKFYITLELGSFYTNNNNNNNNNNNR